MGIDQSDLKKFNSITQEFAYQKWLICVSTPKALIVTVILGAVRLNITDVITFGENYLFGRRAVNYINNLSEED